MLSKLRVRRRRLVMPEYHQATWAGNGCRYKYPALRWQRHASQPVHHLGTPMVTEGVLVDCKESQQGPVRTRDLEGCGRVPGPEEGTPIMGFGSAAKYGPSLPIPRPRVPRSIMEQTGSRWRRTVTVAVRDAKIPCPGPAASRRTQMTFPPGLPSVSVGLCRLLGTQNSLGLGMVLSIYYGGSFRRVARDRLSTRSDLDRSLLSTAAARSMAIDRQTDRSPSTNIQHTVRPPLSHARLPKERRRPVGVDEAGRQADKVSVPSH